MNRADYLRELDEAGRDLKRYGGALLAAAHPTNLVRSGVSRGWKWWLPGASVAGFAAARWLRRPARPKNHQDSAPGSSSGAAYWVPTLLKLLPKLLAQLMPLFLSWRAARKP